MASQLEPETSGKHGIFPRGSVMDFFFIFFFFPPPLLFLLFGCWGVGKLQCP